MRSASILAVLALALLAACSPAPEKDIQIATTGWIVENLPSDWWSEPAADDPTLLYQFTVKLSANAVASDIEEGRVFVPGSSDSWWTLKASSFSDSQHGWGMGSRTNKIYGETGSSAKGHFLPLGTMNVEVRLKNGKVLKSTITSSQPGSTAGGFDYVYNDKISGTTGLTGNLVKVLTRPTVASAVKNNGAETLTVTFTDDDSSSSAYNGWVWFYDAEGNYIGGSGDFRQKATPHNVLSILNSGSAMHDDGAANTVNLTRTGLVGASGGTVSQVDFESISKLRLIVTDGGQYSSFPDFNAFDYSALSSLTSVTTN